MGFESIEKVLIFAPDLLKHTNHRLTVYRFLLCCDLVSRRPHIDVFAEFDATDLRLWRISCVSYRQGCKRGV